MSYIYDGTDYLPASFFRRESIDCAFTLILKDGVWWECRELPVTELRDSVFYKSWTDTEKCAICYENYGWIKLENGNRELPIGPQGATSVEVWEYPATTIPACGHSCHEKCMTSDKCPFCRQVIHESQSFSISGSLIIRLSLYCFMTEPPANAEMIYILIP